MVELLILFLAWLFRGLRKEVEIAIAGVGIPESLEEVEVVAERLHPRISLYRRRIALQQRVLIKRELADMDLSVWVPPAREYPRSATVKMVARAAGLDGNEVRTGSGVVDEGARTGEVRKRPVSVEEFADRIEEGARRHSSKVAKDMVMDTADANLVFDYDEDLDMSDFDDVGLTAEDYWREEEERYRKLQESRNKGADIIRLPALDESGADAGRGRDSDWRKAKPGVVLGWARVLRGTENCGFCAMLASRGPVYDSAETAGLSGMSARGVRGAREMGQKYHDNCDCDVVMVVKGQPWDGEEQYKALKDMWEDARDNPNEYERSLMESNAPRLVTPFARFRSRFGAAMREDRDSFTPPGSKRALDNVARIS